MRYLGVDLGERRVGLAISDPLGLTARGLETLDCQGHNWEEIWHKIKELVEEWEVGQVVVGLPKNMNGTLGPQGKNAQEFAAGLEKVLPPTVGVVMWDERLTTVAAERGLVEADLSRKRRKNIIDQVAAALILEGYMRYQKNATERVKNDE
ncbi:MAG TPA: Holliday junction resolvase RuvX [Bacillota bacterium]|jgi:putative Holliday junction resolvase|nr:Holliday junction resolvase RuvX [Bacillota bacterium]